MGALLVTVAGPHQRRQLSLPGDWPIRDLLPALVDLVGGSDTGSWALRSGDRRLPEERSLAACGVGNGATLVLDRLSVGAQPPSSEPTISPSQPRPSGAVPRPVTLMPPPPPPPAQPPLREPEPAPSQPVPRQFQPPTPGGRRWLVTIGTVVGLILLAVGASWILVRPPLESPAPQASPTGRATRGLPPILDLSSVIHGTIVGTDSIQVGYFSRTPEGASEAAYNYLWALAGSDDASGLLKRIAVPGRARSLGAWVRDNRDPLMEQFYLGFRRVQPTVQHYDTNEPTVTVPVLGETFEVQLRWMDDIFGGDWKLASIQRPDTGTPLPQPSPS